MTDFVISEDELIGAEIGELELCESVHIRSRPLSDELKKERERVLDKYLDELQKEIGESMDYIDWDSVEAVYIRVRGEP